MAKPPLRAPVLLAAMLAACSSFEAAEGGRANDDAGASEGGTQRDATADAPADAGARTCSGRPDGDPAHFCDDFDQGGRIDLRWTQTRASGAGTIGESSGSSPPRAFQASLAGGMPPATAQLVRQRPADLDVATKQRITLSFALRIDAAPYASAGSSGFTHVALITFETPSCVTSGGNRLRDIELTLFANQDFRLVGKGLLGTCDDAGAGSDFFSVAAPFKPGDLAGAYHRVTIDVQRSGCNGENGASLRMSIDGVPSECRTLGIDPFTMAKTFEVALGASAGGSTAIQDTKLSYDDVGIDLQ